MVGRALVPGTYIVDLLPIRESYMFTLVKLMYHATHAIQSNIYLPGPLSYLSRRKGQKGDS